MINLEDGISARILSEESDKSCSVLIHDVCFPLFLPRSLGALRSTAGCSQGKGRFQEGPPRMIFCRRQPQILVGAGSPEGGASRSRGPQSAGRGNYPEAVPEENKDRKKEAQAKENGGRGANVRAEKVMIRADLLRLERG